MQRDGGIPEEAADLERYLNIDNIVAHARTEKKNPTERGAFDGERGRRDYCQNNEAWNKSEGMNQ